MKEKQLIICYTKLKSMAYSLGKWAASLIILKSFLLKLGLAEGPDYYEHLIEWE
jgi:hypothetical protein